MFDLKQSFLRGARPMLALLALFVVALMAPAAQATWTIQSSPNPSSTYNRLFGLGCTSLTACLAVGTTSGVSGFAALAESWNGSTWAALSPATPSNTFDDAACAGAPSTLCIAVGSNSTSAQAQSFNGSTWSNLSVPSPSGTVISELEGISCSASNACTAVGVYTTTSGATLPLAVRWNGSTWSLQTAALPAGAVGAEFQAVSCPSSTACYAVGFSLPSFGPQKLLVEVWNGSSWSVQTASAPVGATDSILQDVSCVSTTACTAVGTYEDASSVQKLLAYGWNGSAWSPQTVPNPTGSTPTLEGVSCVSSPGYGCAAVGSYLNASGTQRVTLIEVFNGSWSIQTSPNPAGAIVSQLAEVFCSSTCEAVGDYTDTNGHAFTLAEVGP
jgi:hypothetical protein